LRYNAMLISVFELLADAREQVATVNASIAALRDYWVADADLQAALSGASGGRPVPVRAATMTAAPARGGHRCKELHHDHTTRPSGRRRGAGRDRSIEVRRRCGSGGTQPAERGDPAAARATEQPALSTGRDIERLDAPLAREGRLEGVPPRRRARRAG